MELLGTDRLKSIGLLILRLAGGVGLMTHGYAKLFGTHMFQFTQAGGHVGFSMPAFLEWMIALSEFLGGLLLAVGLRTRVAALVVSVPLAVSVFVYHAGDPLSKRELAALYLAIGVALMFIGPGRLALDRS